MMIVAITIITMAPPFKGTLANAPVEGRSRAPLLEGRLRAPLLLCVTIIVACEPPSAWGACKRPSLSGGALFALASAFKAPLWGRRLQAAHWCCGRRLQTALMITVMTVILIIIIIISAPLTAMGATCKRRLLSAACKRRQCVLLPITQ